MDPRKRLERKIERERKKIEDLRRQIVEAEAYIRGLEDSLPMIPASNGEARVTTLRPGTTISRARDVLRDAAKPLHINEILNMMGLPADRKNRTSLAGSMAAYVRRNEVFAKTAPNTFVLIDAFGQNEDESETGNQEGD